ncbi:MAG: ferrous iron transport protein B [Bifidobacteriaceae bacterium]|nr:ferrous iron transport protein B [Bifidobacteriaceae bacterium]
MGHSGHHHHRRGLAVLIPEHHHIDHNETVVPHEGPHGEGTEPRIVFVGNPNVGKSTLFNALLGTNAAVMNAPGTTVLIEQGDMVYKKSGQTWQFIDTPGTASLGALSPDELVAAQTAVGWGDHPDPDVVVSVLDATSLSRSLYLLSQLIDAGTPLVVGVSMMDLARKQGVSIDLSLLSNVLGGTPVVEVDGRTGRGTTRLLEAIDAQLNDPRGPAQPAVEGLPGAEHFADTGWDGVLDWIKKTSDRRFEWVAETLKAADTSGESSVIRTTFSDRLDSVLLHPVAGILIFLAVMFLVFEATTTLAGPLIDWFDVQVRGWFTTGIDWGFVHAAGTASLDGWFHSLVVDGLLEGVVTVLTFVPPMGIMFIILSLLEDSGYLSRAAFVMDKAMRVIGLDGRAFLPLVVGFGCNLPALAATRTLPDSRQRLMTGLLVPFTSCSARLSVYIVLAYAFFAQYAGLAIFLMYVMSIVVILLVGLILRRTQFKDLVQQPFAMGLPSYQMPKMGQLAKSVGARLWAFVSGASSIIITMIALMWVLSAIPVTAGAQGDNSFGHVDSVQNSVYGTVAGSIAPIFAPAGFDDWHASAALITGFVAKEVVVGSMSQSYAISEPDDASEADEGTGTLGTALRSSFEESSGGHAQAAAAAFMVFVLAYTPCLATVAEERRQFGIKTALQSVGMGLVIAYLLAVVIFRVGVLL